MWGGSPTRAEPPGSAVGPGADAGEGARPTRCCHRIVRASIGIRYAVDGTVFGLGWAFTGACPGAAGWNVAVRTT